MQTTLTSRLRQLKLVQLPRPGSGQPQSANRLLLEQRRESAAGLLTTAKASQRGASSSSSSSSTGDLGTAGQQEVLEPLPDISSFPPPPPSGSDHPGWADDVWASPLNISRRIWCNRSLNMRRIKAIGFDMDYTLAQYRPETFEKLAYHLTVDNLVKTFGYPKVLYDFQFDWRYMQRGLTIDKKRGNILKVDRHKYVKLAFHGFKPLSREERVATYSGAEQFDFDEPDFALIDTLFSLAEAHLFMQLVELGDAQPDAIPAGKQPADLYRDVRTAVDLCHRDGSLKRAVAADPGKYIHSDPRLVACLEMLRDSGKKLFVGTNSLWDYTHVVMNFLLTGRVGPDRNEDWLEYFDVVITGSGKPAFFSQKKPLFEVHLPTGMLQNTEGGNPVVPIVDADLPRLEYGSSAPRGLTAQEKGQRARVFQGGNYVDLHKMLGVHAGSEVLYIGDHIYGDILRSKKTLGWRTMLVVPELETELGTLATRRSAMVRLRGLRQQRDALDDQIQRLSWAARGQMPQPHAASRPGDNQHLQQQQQQQSDAGHLQTLLSDLLRQRDEVREQHRQQLKEHHEAFHEVWGQLLKTGYQNSRFAHQVERYACIYTSHVSNLSFYSPEKSYRGRMDAMAHEPEPFLDDLTAG